MDLHKNYLQIAVMNKEGRVLRNSKIDNNLKQTIYMDMTTSSFTPFSLRIVLTC